MIKVLIGGALMALILVGPQLVFVWLVRTHR